MPVKTDIFKVNIEHTEKINLFIYIYEIAKFVRFSHEKSLFRVNSSLRIFEGSAAICYVKNFFKLTSISNECLKIMAIFSTLVNFIKATIKQPWALKTQKSNQLWGLRTDPNFLQKISIYPQSINRPTKLKRLKKRQRSMLEGITIHSKIVKQLTQTQNS